VVNATAGKATNLNADKLDGQDSSAFQPSYERTVVVSPAGTNAQNGQALLDAIANITDASESKPYLLYVEPGTYDLGNGSLSMESWVDIEGSGELNTIITSSVEGCPAGGPMGEATMEGASNVELRFLTVRNTGTGNCNVAVLNSSASPRLTHMTVEAFGPAAAATAGVVNIAGSNPNMTQVTAAAVGSPDENSGVINAQMSSPFIEQSRLIANGPPVSDPVDNALRVEGGTTQVVDTQLVGAVERLSGQLLCFGNYGVSMDAVSCPSS
jgi:hypothetical protein